jgi:hypothetical protein
MAEGFRDKYHFILWFVLESFAALLTTNNLLITMVNLRGYMKWEKEVCSDVEGDILE